MENKLVNPFCFENKGVIIMAVGQEDQLVVFQLNDQQYASPLMKPRKSSEWRM
ncbi:hypothetical protein N752_26355 [Desulforamulus aquiferis]|nr:hypothetical protein N752_26355 [Desulforamulus aquiferis]